MPVQYNNTASTEVILLRRRQSWAPTGLQKWDGQWVESIDRGAGSCLMLYWPRPFPRELNRICVGDFFSSVRCEFEVLMVRMPSVHSTMPLPFRSGAQPRFQSWGGVQFLGLGYCTEQNTDGIPSFVDCSLLRDSNRTLCQKSWGVRTPVGPPVVALLVPFILLLSTSRLWSCSFRRWWLTGLLFHW